MKYFMSMLFAAFLTMAAPGPAEANTTCDGSCTVTVCSGSTCTVYYCDTESCVVIARYKVPKSMNADPAGGKGELTLDRITGDARPSAHCSADSLCPFTVCEGPVCVLRGLVGGEPTILGTAENPDYLFDQIINDYREPK